MPSAERKLLKHLFIIIVTILLSELINYERSRKIDPNRFQNREIPEQQKHQKFEPYNGQKGENYLGVMNFGKSHKKINSSWNGSASFLGNNYFISARHVIDGCSFANPGDVYHHPNSDLSIFKKNTNLSNDVSVTIKENDNYDKGFIVGFPARQEASAKTKYIGYAKQLISGDFEVDNKVLVWAFHDLNVNLTKLNGMSGGAVLDENGDLIGVLSGEFLRRGRIITTTLENTKTALNDNNINYNFAKHPNKINQSEAFDYIKQNKVIRVTCWNLK